MTHSSVAGGKGSAQIRGNWLSNVKRGNKRLPGWMIFVAMMVACFGTVAAPLKLLSPRDPSIPLPAGGNGDSVAPRISADGAYVLFSSSANDLVEGDNGQLGLDVFCWDRLTGNMLLVSTNENGTGGGNGSSTLGVLSTNARYVLFESRASDLVANDTNNAGDIFLRDLTTGTTRLVSVAVNGGSGNGDSWGASMTPDGRYVVFVSTATNLITGDTNGLPDLFVRDLVLQTNILVSVGAAPPASTDVDTETEIAAASITADGRYVAFFSAQPGLVSSVPTSSKGEVYVRDLAAGSTIWASTNAASLAESILGSAYATAPSYHPVISSDGEFVTFKTGPADGANPDLILRFDMATGTTVLISTNAVSTTFSSDDVYGPEMTPDGRFVAYVRSDGSGTNFSDHSSIWVWDGFADTNVLVSCDTNGTVPVGGVSDTPVLSPDGRFVVFLSDARGLVTNEISPGFHVYRRDLQNGVTELMDADSNGRGTSDCHRIVGSLSADGRFVVFSAPDGSLVAGDNNHAYDVFLRDTADETTTLISRRNAAVASHAGDGISVLGQYSISDDGRRVAYASTADDLVPNDTNGESDVFVRDIFTGSNLLVSAGTDGSPALGGFSADPVISPSGRFVAFISSATNLAAGISSYSNDFFNNIYVRDLDTGGTILASASTNGTSANRDCSSPVISADGRYVAFLSRASNLVPGVTGGGVNTFWRDLDRGMTISVSGNSFSDCPPSMSADGRYVTYCGSSYQLWVRDTQLGVNIYTNPGPVSSACLSPTGKRLLFTTGGGVVLADLVSNVTTYLAPTPRRIQGSQCWSSDGRFIVFTTYVNLTDYQLPDDNNGANDVYLYDCSNGDLSLVSMNSSGNDSGNGPSDAPAISGDGRFVVYRTMATDIGTGTAGLPPHIVLFDRYTGSSTLLATPSPDGEVWSSWKSGPSLSGNGGEVVFLSWGGSLGVNDQNRMPSVLGATWAPWGTADSDSDGIPDKWMMHYFGHPTGEGADHSLADDDADGDGMSNRQEYLAGTDPKVSASVLQLQISQGILGDNGATIHWQAVPGRHYRFQYKDRLENPLWLDVMGNPFVVGTEGYLTVTPDQTTRYYRILVTE